MLGLKGVSSRSFMEKLLRSMFMIRLAALNVLKRLP